MTLDYRAGIIAAVLAAGIYAAGRVRLWCVIEDVRGLRELFAARWVKRDDHDPGDEDRT